MRTQNVSIVSIRPDRANPLSLDLKDILSCLGRQLDRWIWCVRHLDWLGPDAENFCRRVEAAGAAGLWLSSDDLLRQAREVYQTVEGEFMAFPRDIDRQTVEEAELDLRSFPQNRAELAIVAVDGGLFEVYAKDTDFLAAMKQLSGVRDEDPGVYF